MTTTAFKLKYADNVGFCADMGGRGFMMPTSMVIRDDGLIFVVSRSNTTARNIIGIQKVTRHHDYLGQIGKYGSEAGNMIWPSALALDSENNLYLADDYLHRITVFDRDGGLVSTWGTKGTAEGEIDGPSGILFDSDDNMVLVDHRNNRIQKFTKDGKFISTFGSAGDGEGQFNLPWGIAQDRQGNLYVADWRNDRIQKFTADGEFLAKFGTSGSGDRQFNRPSGVAIDSEGNIYVADWGNQRVQVLDPDGHFLAKLRGEADLNPWALEYLDAQQDENRARQSYQPIYEVDTDDVHEESARIEPYFWDPVTVVLDDEDRLYVLETCRHRFQIYERA